MADIIIGQGSALTTELTTVKGTETTFVDDNGDTKYVSINNILINSSYSVNTVAEFVNIPSTYTTSIVKSSNNGGVYYWTSTGTADDINIFSGNTGYWNKIYVNSDWDASNGAALILNKPDLNLYALANNVLALNNTTEFIPSDDYEPATKKYVDDAVTESGGYNDESAQDAIGSILANTEYILLSYNDATPSFSASLSNTAITLLGLANTSIQAGDLATVATSGSYTDLSDKLSYTSSSDINTGTDSTKIINCESLIDSKIGQKGFGCLVSDPSGDAITTGNGKACIFIPAEYSGWIIKKVEMALSTASTSGIVQVQLRRQDDQDILSTRIQCDANERFSNTAATAYVINTSYDDIETNGSIYFIDIDAAGTGAKGLVVTIFIGAN